MGRRLILPALVLSLAVFGLAYAEGPPELCEGCWDGSPETKSGSVRGCTVTVTHGYTWGGNNNHPYENSLYPGDSVGGNFGYTLTGCTCGTSTSGPTAEGDWSRITGGGDGKGPYTQIMKIRPDSPTPTSSTIDGYLHMAEYDKTGRTRTHHVGALEGHGMTEGAKFSVTAGARNPRTDECETVTVTQHAEFRYRNPFWETSIHEHHILDPNGYPASNLDFSNYPKDAIPLEAGSNLVLGEYRWPTIKITHEVLDGGVPVAEFVCGDKNCEILVPDTPAGSGYIGNQPYDGDALSEPWWVVKRDGGNVWTPGTKGLLDGGEAIFVIPAARTGPISIVSTMTNDGEVIGRGYNTTWQFVPSYQPVLDWGAVTNTALGGSSALDRPVSVIVDYNGTISDTLHYCAVGTAYDLDGSPLELGERGGRDAWGRVAGAACPERVTEDIWGKGKTKCNGPCTYDVNPDRPAAEGWGRWSAVNPETRAMLGGFAGSHTVCLVGGGECVEHETKYLNWDYVPETDRDFVPACVIDLIAAEGDGPVDRPHGQKLTNKPKPANWGTSGGWAGQSFTVGDGAEPHSYRGVFTGWPNPIPKHYVVDPVQCEASVGIFRDCVARGGECLPEYDRRCESVFEPFLYPDDYVMSGHDRLQDLVVGWCGKSPTMECSLEAYGVIDEVMVSICTRLGVDYGGHNQVVDASAMDEEGSITPNRCHNMVAVGVYAPTVGGSAVDDWRACYGEVPGPTDTPSVWPDGKPDGPPQCGSTFGGEGLAVPNWEKVDRNVYVPYTPSTGAFGGVIERPGNMLLDDGTLTCDCEDSNNNSLCDHTEASLTDGQDLDGYGIIDDWDTLTVDGAVQCLDRTGTTATAIAACWAKYGRNHLMEGAESTADDLNACLVEAAQVPDGPDGECSPALVLGVVGDDGSVDFTGMVAYAGELGMSAAEFVSDPDLAPKLGIPFLGVGDVIPVPYIVDGEHAYCDESELWCVSSGDTYQQHNRYDVCQDPERPASVKRIPAPATMPPLYQPVFDERWPPECLPEYPIGDWSRPDHPVSLDLAGQPAEWPTSDDGKGTPPHVSTGGQSTMMLHAGSGVVRFGVCDDCAALHNQTGTWTGTFESALGGTVGKYDVTMRHPPFVVNQQGHARVVAVEPCEDCEDGWRVDTSVPGIGLVVTAYPDMERPVTEAGEMVAHACQVDGDSGTGLLNINSPAGAFSSWMDGLTTVFTFGLSSLIEFWHELSCRDTPGMSVTIQDYEAARHGIAAKREAGQPWTVAEGVNDVSVEVFRNGIWLNTLSILEHRGQCTEYTWSPHVTPGHTSCPAAVAEMSSCWYNIGDTRWCLERFSAPDVCSNVFVEDGINKKWEFTEDERFGLLTMAVGADECSIQAEDACLGGCADRFDSCVGACGGDVSCGDGCAADLLSCEDGCAAPASCVGEDRVDWSACVGCGDVPTAYRLPDGKYVTQPMPEDVEGFVAPVADPETMAWKPPSGDRALLRCEAVTGDGAGGIVKNIPAEELDYTGGSFACQQVQACKKTVTNYKCMSGEVVPHVVCEEPEESFSVLDMPYEEVMGSVGRQSLHVKATCPPDHPVGLAFGSPGCDGNPIYDTHQVSELANHTTIYVDYHGVGEMSAGRDDPGSYAIHLRPPVTFGAVHWILVEWDGGAEMMVQDRPCVSCLVERSGPATITVGNVYGGTLSTHVEAAESNVLARVDADEIGGVIWLYLPLLVVGAAAYIVIRKYRRQLGIWDDDDDESKALD